MTEDKKLDNLRKQHDREINSVVQDFSNLYEKAFSSEKKLQAHVVAIEELGKIGQNWEYGLIKKLLPSFETNLVQRYYQKLYKTFTSFQQEVSVMKFANDRYDRRRGDETISEASIASEYLNGFHFEPENAPATLDLLLSLDFEAIRISDISRSKEEKQLPGILEDIVGVANLPGFQLTPEQTEKVEIITNRISSKLYEKSEEDKNPWLEYIACRNTKRFQNKVKKVLKKKGIPSGYDDAECELYYNSVSLAGDEEARVYVAEYSSQIRIYNFEMPEEARKLGFADYLADKIIAHAAESGKDIIFTAKIGDHDLAMLKEKGFFITPRINQDEPDYQSRYLDAKWMVKLNEGV